MKKRFGPSLYFASDKVIFDAMNHAKVTTDLIRELLFERNIIVSSKTSKYELAQYFSRLTADYYDHRDIGGKLGKAATRERVTYTEIESNLSREEVVNGLKAVKTKLEDQESHLTIDAEGDRIIATLSYEYIDYTEVEFRQVQPRDAIIEFSKDSSGKYIVRNTQNKIVDVVVEEVFAAIDAGRETPLSRHRITLIGHPDPVSRTKFFNALIRGIEDHAFVTVTEAYCYKPDVASLSDNADDEDADELEERAYVEKVTLKGTGVTKSFVIDDLYKKGYYIVKAVWRVRPTSSMDSDIFELEAQFGEPKDCTDFAYQARTVILCEDGKPTQKKRGPKSEEQDALLRRIESAAKLALASLE